ncbi:MAG: amidase family protein, partial [Bacteroidetes bacterium]|nr:amidase family protein [Bacteroidota bacterium]
RAISDLMDLGAKIVDPVDIPDYPELTAHLWCNTFQHDVNLYLASLGDAAPHRTLASVVESGRYAPYIESRLRRALEITEAPEDRDPICADIFSTPANIAFREAASRMMDENELDAFIYPTWSNPPRMIGDMESPAGDNSQHLSPHTGFPAITVPMGVTYDGLPAGVTFLGREYSEPLLIGFAYSYEQATRHRKPPARFRELQ